MPTFYRNLPSPELSAFSDDNQMVMNNGKPTVEWYLTISETQEFVQTLEKAYDDEPNYLQRDGLSRIICTLKAALIIHQRQHETLIASAPNEMLQEYLSSYAKAMSNGEIK